MSHPMRETAAGLRQRHNRIKEQRTGGFTLVELIVVLVVLGILASLAVMSLIGWQDHADFKRQNEYAQSIFTAAQIQLTQYAERGQLTALSDAVSLEADGKKAEPSSYKLSAQGELRDSQGNIFQMEDVWQTNAGGEAKIGDIYYLMVKKGDYKHYIEHLKGQNVTDLSDKRIKALFDLIDPYVADKEMLDAAICIEFDPNPRVALVYSVFYNQNVQYFTYEEVSGAGSGGGSLRDRREAQRREDKTGYYGAEILSMGTNANKQRPVISRLRLNNEETLNLTWAVDIADTSSSEKVLALKSLIYQIDVYRPANVTGAEDTLLATIVLGKTDQELDTSAPDPVAECQVSLKGESGTWETVPMEFPVSLDISEQSIRLVLDALDLYADESSDPARLRDSAGISRLGIDADDIYCEVYGRLDGIYQKTARKTSNTENAFFAKEQITEGSAGRTFQIGNVRHFNNLRYYEKTHGSRGELITYRLSSDLDWNMFLNKGQAYYGLNRIFPGVDNSLEDYYFRPFVSLGANSVFGTGEGETPHVLSNFRMKYGTDRFGENTVPASDMTDVIGLFLLNKGTIRSVTLEEVSVTGNAEAAADSGAAGAFCGRNQGNLSNLTVKSGSITGVSCVGGIMGAADDSAAVTYSGLVNRAAVTGSYYVGGIAGRLQTRSGGAIQLQNCENYGKIRGSSLEEEAYYIGGIAGSCEAGADGTILLSGCNSSPSYTEEEIEALVDQIASGSTDGLSGIYVGGIVGMNDGAKLSECNTLRETSGKAGYVIGKDYVGGIAGVNAGVSASELTGGKDSRNQANVIGRSYVGGIVGCNAAIARTEGWQLVFDKHYTAGRSVVSSWKNEGAVLAAGDYSGGITGCNYGDIRDCTSDVDYNSEIKNLTRVSSDSSYAGGIAGYNRGKLELTAGSDAIFVSGVVSGKNYVGGIVGYNDYGGQISGYGLEGGYIQGSKFVGGMIGLNSEPSVFDGSMVSSPNDITGDYFVGGIIGGNLLPVTTTDIRARFQTDNFLGNLTAEQGAFAGGFIGYNCLLSPSVLAAGEDPGAKIRSEADALCQNPNLNPIADDGAEAVGSRLLEAEQAADSFLKGYRAVGNIVMQIEGENTDEITQAHLGSVKALAYVGGVIGYNAEDTPLHIKNVENITLVEATGSLRRAEKGQSEEKLYSYAGGIIGKVAQNVTIENCRNRDVGEVKSRGTYTGGLTEINYGLIKDCAAGSLGDGTASYVGGLAGVNMASEEDKGIVSCSVSGTIMGRDYVGGLTAENYGRIVDPRLDCSIEASGEHVGGVTGFNYEKGTIHLSLAASDIEMKVSISGTATNVGGLIGTNRGEILSGSGGIENNEDTIISGRSNVGGFIGVQENAASTISKLVNRANVQAEVGYAGGIIGITGTNASGLVIERCDNYGEVEVLAAATETENRELSDTGSAGPDGEEWEDASAAGGITAVNYGTIKRCRNLGEIKGSGGLAAGISAVNRGKILSSQVGYGEKEALDGSRTLEFYGGKYVGGVTAVNEKNATIKDSSAVRLILQNQDDSEKSCIGGIAALNLGAIDYCLVGVEGGIEETATYQDTHPDAADQMTAAIGRGTGDDMSYTLMTADRTEAEGSAVVLISNAADVVMGGVAGWNYGTIKGNGAADCAVALAELRFRERSMNYYGYMGGITGVNEGKVSSYEFNGLIHGTANDPSNTPAFNPNYDFETGGRTVYGYGGITGLNGRDDESYDAEISHCVVGLARISGTGDANNRTNVGGVAGVNGKSAEIKEVQFAEIDRAGGQVAGDYPVPDDALFSYKVNNKTYSGSVWVGADGYGHTGGVAGLNHGQISGVNWTSGYMKRREDYFADGVYSPQQEVVDQTGVLVVNQTGQTGGIVGYNRRTGQISRAATGHDWLVYTAAQGQDNGTGGIIGYTISDMGLEACDNHGTVLKTASGSNSVGGIIGRSEVATTGSWRLLDCRNFGTVTAYKRAGGMIGHWKYKGGRLENCKNYGTISTTNSTAEGIGGMVGTFYGIAPNEAIYLTGCENHGTIGNAASSSAGGIIGEENSTKQAFRLVLEDCVNIGLIGGSGANSAGMVGMKNNARLTLTRCRNYGYSLSKNGNFTGMYKDAGVTMKECFGITDVDAVVYPIAKGINAEGFYFAEAAAAESEGSFWVSRIEAESSKDNIEAGANLYHVIDGQGSDNTWFRAGSKAAFTIEFNEPVYLQDILLDWNRDESVSFRYYSYQLEYLDQDGQVIKSEAVEETDSNSVAGGHLHEAELSQPVSAVRISEAQAWLKSALDGNRGASKNAALKQFTAHGTARQGGAIMADDKRRAASGSTTGTNTKNVTFTRTPPVTQDGAKIGCPLYVSGNRAFNRTKGIEIADLNGAGLDDIYLREHLADRYTTSKYAYQLFQRLDDYLIFSSNTSALDTPVFAGHTADGGFYTVTWKPVLEAQYYTLVCEYKSGETKIRTTEYTVYNSTDSKGYVSVQIPADGAEGADGMSLQLTAHAVTSKGSVIDSLPGKTDIPFGIILPTPQIRWELVSVANNTYRIVLENQEEYQRIVEEAKADSTKKPIAMDQIEISTTTSKLGKAITFSAAAGAYVDTEGNYILANGNGKDNITFTSYASPHKTENGVTTVVDGYEQSRKVIREAILPTGGNYNQQGNAAGRFADVGLAADAKSKEDIIAGVGFSGNTMDTLSYEIKLKRSANENESWVVYYRSELTAVDPALGVPVSLAVSPQMLVSSTSEAAMKISLGSLPSDFLEKNQDGTYRYQNVLVRTYPTKMSNDVVYQGKEVKLPKDYLTAAQLETVQVSEYGDIVETGGKPLIEDKLLTGRTVKPGYVIERVGENQYTLYFNTLLKTLDSNDGYKDNEDWKYKASESGNTYMRYQIFYHKIDLNEALKQTQPEPAVYAEPEYLDGQWKDGAYDEKEQFVIKWDQDAGAEPAYVNGQGQTPYNLEAEYRCTLTGTMPDGSVTVIENNRTVTTKGSDGNRPEPYNCYIWPDAGKWNYTNVHLTLTRVGTTVDGKTAVFPSTVERDFKMRLRLSTIGQPNVTPARDENGIVLKDGLNYRVSWTGLEKQEELDALDHYEVTVENEKTGAEANRLTVPTASPSNATAVDVSLDSFKRNEPVKISVKAIAKKGETVSYRDSIPGTVRELTIPNRLFPPDMGEESDPDANMKVNVPKDIQSVEEFEKGCLEITMKESYRAQNGKYQIALEVYDQVDEHGNTVGDAAVIAGLPDKEHPAAMTGNLNNAKYTVSGIPSDYAGKYVKVVLKAVSDGNISSCWTDEAAAKEEDEERSQVAPYRIFKLPRVLVDHVEITEDMNGVDCAYRLIKTKNGVETDEGEVTAGQKVLYFTSVENVDRYDITIIQKPEQAGRILSASEEMQISYVSWLEIQKAGDGYRGIYRTTEGEDGSGKKTEFAIPLDGSDIPLPYQKTYRLAASNASTSYTVTLQARLRAETDLDGRTSFCLILPDFVGLKDNTVAVNDSCAYTEQFLVQARAADPARYEDSSIAAMIQETDDFQTAVLEGTRPEASEPGGVAAMSAVKAEKDGYAYRVGGFSGTTRYLAEIRSGAENLGWYSVAFKKGAFTYGEEIWLPDAFAKYGGQTLTVTFRNILDFVEKDGHWKGGLSEWSQDSYSVALPVIDTSPVELSQLESEAIPYQLRESSRRLLKKAVEREVTARQTQVTWIHELTESQIAGYQVLIHNKNTGSDYSLELDLRRNRVGQFPGLTDYLTGEGRQLYVVGYDLDGDAVAYERVDTASPSDAVASGSDAGAAYRKLTTPDDGAFLTATASDSQLPDDQAIYKKENGVLYLACVLKAELIEEDDEVTAVRFTLTLPDAVSDGLEGTAAEQFKAVFEDGLYFTESVEVAPVMVNRYYELPDREEFYLEKSAVQELIDDLEDTQ